MVIKKLIKECILDKGFALLCISKKLCKLLAAYLMRNHLSIVAAAAVEAPQNQVKQLVCDIMKIHPDAAALLLALPQAQFEYLLASLTSRNVEYHFSQEGEDVFLQRVLQNAPAGFFVDVGAHHPLRFSNTYSLYRKGWRGINIDATPGSMLPFKELRPDDINIECAVSDSIQPLRFHCFKEPALNTFEDALADTYIQAGWEQLEVREMLTRPLKSILQEHLPEGQSITLMTIDVEGEEMAVLRSNDWNKYSPEWIILEVLDTPLDKLAQHPTISFLSPYGYIPVAKLCQSVILKKTLA